MSAKRFRMGQELNRLEPVRLSLSVIAVEDVNSR